MSDNMPRREWGILEEKLARIIALCKEAKDEIERLREDFDTLTATCRNYAAENAKLREALQSIIDQEAETVCLWDAQQIARNALKN